jgi:hypothetical protein
MGRSQHSKSALSQIAPKPPPRPFGGAQPIKQMTDKQLAPLLITMASFDAVAISQTDILWFQLAIGALLLVSFALGFLAAFGEEEKQ